MIDTHLKDGTHVEIQWTNKNPNIKGPQQYTNGAAPAWVSFNGGPWLHASSYDSRYVSRVREALEICMFKNELVELLELTNY